MTTSTGSLVDIKARGEAMQAFAREHGKEAYFYGIASMKPAVMVIVEMAFPAEGQSESRIETARTWGELRAILGY